jgi:hypothetical protein
MPATKPNPDLAKPSHLSPEGEKAYRAFLAFLKAKGRTHTGGGRTFYSPEEWAERGEEYGTKSVLVIVHDGGDVAPVCNLDYEQYKLNDQMVEAMAEAGFFVEGCTCWYSAVYRA